MLAITHTPEPAKLSHNLPVPLSSFVGRGRELAAADHHLARCRCLTLTGPGGVGKSRLALQVAARQLAEHPDGVRFVELGAVSDPLILPQVLGATLGIPDIPQRPALSVVIDSLRDKRVLLVLDNCEHLLASCKALADAIISSCPDVRVLATSREPLGAAGETTLPVPSLAVPPAGARASLSDLAGYEAVQLFVERATTACPRFTLTERNGAAVVELCRRLDGIPLALELAVAPLGLLSPDQIVARLTDSFRLLVASEEAPLRPGTLRTAIAWSHDTLTEPEQTLWRRISAFPDSFTLAAAEAVCTGDGINPEQICDLAGSLTARSILTVEDRRTERRLHLLESLRAYGREQLAASGEGDRLMARYCQYCAALAEEADPLLAGHEQTAWLDRLEQEHENLRAALRHTIAHRDRETALRLVCALAHFWQIRHHFREARRWLDAAVAIAPQCDTLTARALTALADMAEMMGDRENAAQRYAEAHQIFRALADDSGLNVTYRSLGRLARAAQDYERAEALCRSGLHHARLARDLHSIGDALNTLGSLAQHHGDYRQAMICYAEALPPIRTTGDQYTLAMTLSNLGSVALAMGELQRASEWLSEAVLLSRRVRAQRITATALFGLGDAARALGDLQRAFDFYRESLELLRADADLELLQVIESMAGAEVLRGNDERAARLFGAAAALKPEDRSSLAVRDRGQNSKYLGRLQARLPEPDFRKCWTEGQAMSRPELITYAVAEPSPRKAEANGSAHAPERHATGLTKRELDVARLAALGLSTQEVGERLHISPRTVAKHEENIRAKLNIPTRVGLAAWAARTRLIEEGRI